MKADLDFANLDFRYRKTDYNIRYYYRDGKWSKGELVSSENLELNIASTCLHYGQACFEGMKVFENREGKAIAFRIDENAKRLQRSAKKIFMVEVPQEIFIEAVYKVVDANRKYIPPYGTGASLYVRPLLIGISPHIGVKASEEYIFLILVLPVGPYFKGGFKPVKLLTVEDIDRAAPYGVGDIKAAGNYAAGMRGTFMAKQNGYADVLYLDAVERKYIDESGPANFIAILKNDTYVTPASSSILPSITNASLQTIAKDFGLSVEKRQLAISEITNFAEAACCGTAAVLTPIGTIKYRDIIYNFYDDGNTAGPHTTRLYDTLTGIQAGALEDKYNWTFEIP